MIKTAIHRDGSQHKVHLGGWKKQHTDPRDEHYRIKLHPSFLASGVAPSGDLRSFCSAVEDQGELGSCTANAFAGLVEANEKRGAAKFAELGSSPLVVVSGITQASDGTVSFITRVKSAAPPAPPTPPSPTPAPTPPAPPAPPAHSFVDCSRLFHYYATRTIEGTTSEDSGATIRDTAKAGNQYGVLDEKNWPYDVSKFADRPPQNLWDAAAKKKVTSYHSITDGDLLTLKATLAQGYLIEYGFNVYSYFMGQDMATKAFLDLPQRGESLEGGHAVDLCGWDDNKVNPFRPTTKGAFLVRNSWGTSWGLSGYFWVSYDYIANTGLASDFWVVVSSPLT